MTKIINIPSSKQMIENTINFCDGFILGLDKLCINMPITFKMNELIDIIKLLNKNNKEIFINLNKNMHDDDLEYLKEILLKLNELNITAVMYYDIAIVNLKDKLNLQYDLVWSQEHMTTNASTCRYWYQFGAKYAYLSSEITLDEIINIKANTPSKLLVNVFGYIPIFASKRHLVKNYLKTFSLNDNSSHFYMEKEGNKYILVDDENGTVAYSSMILNALEEVLILKQNKIDYLVLNSYMIDNFEQILKMYYEANDKNVLNYDKEIESILNNTSKCFLYKETVYKVKK